MDVKSLIIGYIIGVLSMVLLTSTIDEANAWTPPVAEPDFTVAKASPQCNQILIDAEIKQKMKDFGAIARESVCFEAKFTKFDDGVWRYVIYFIHNNKRMTHWDCARELLRDAKTACARSFALR